MIMIEEYGGMAERAIEIFEDSGQKPDYEKIYISDIGIGEAMLCHFKEWKTPVRIGEKIKYWYSVKMEFENGEIYFQMREDSSELYFSDDNEITWN